MNYSFGPWTVDSVELKCLVTSRGLRIDPEVYRTFGGTNRIDRSALTCNSFRLPDGTIVMATDLRFHLATLSSMFSWDNLKLIRYMSDMKTDFRLTVRSGAPTLCWREETVCPVQLFPATDFYRQRTGSGLPFMGNAVLQGCDWVAFQCLWPCEFAIAGKPCQYCFSGGQFESLARRGRPMPPVLPPEDFCEITDYAIRGCGVNSMQITGGSTFDGKTEEKYITDYLTALRTTGLRELLTGEVLLYITPPAAHETIDRYFALGADRIACSLEVWDDDLAREITPGKREFTTKARHLDALCYTAERFGPGKAFSNFIIGLEPLESFRAGADYLARRGVIPAASVWMPFGKPVRGSMKPPALDYYRAVIDILGELYDKYGLYPAGACGLNVCIEKDIWNKRHGRSGDACC